MAWSDPPRRDLRLLELTLTSRCNLSCEYCYRSRGPEGSLEWATAKAALDLLLASERPAVVLSLLGGEPLLEFELVDRILGYVESRRRRTQAVTVKLTTNGLLLDEAVAELLARHRVRTQISFDGLPALQARRGEGTFEALQELLCELRSRHRRFWTQHVGTTMTVSPASVAQLPSAVRATLALGVHRVELSPDLRSTICWDASRFGELQAAFHEIAAIAVEHFHATGDMPIPVLRPRQGPGGGGCGAPSGEAIAVDVDGQAYGCAGFAPAALGIVAPATRRQLEPLRLGPLLDPSFQQRLARYPGLAGRLELFRSAARTGSALARCSTCPARRECGICPLVLGRDGEEGSVPDFLCGFELAAASARDSVARSLRGTRLLLGMGVPPVLRRLERRAG